jgi:RNA polymerase sigma-70 factor (ECF subfamily)
MNGNSTEAEDLLSQAMVKAWEKAQKYAGKIENFKSWLTTLTRNFWIDLTRRRGANQVEDIEVYAARNELGLVSVDETPASALDCDEKKRVIRAAIDDLPTRLRETFILHFYEELSHQDIAERQKISYQNVCKRISQARAILALKLRGYFIGEDGTKTELAVTSAVTESAIEEMSEGNAEVEAIAGESVTLSVAIAQVESVGGEESPFVAVSVEHSESDSVAATSEGRLEEFNAIGKQIVGAFPPWLSSLEGSLLFHGLRKLVLEVRSEWCRWVEVALCKREQVSVLPVAQFEEETGGWGSSFVPVVWGRQWHQVGKVAGEFVRSLRSPPLYCFPYFQSFVKSLLGMMMRFRFF